MPTVTVDGTVLHYFDDLPTDVQHGVVVMLHGFARNGTFWSGWLPALSAHFRVIRPDIRGCGRNPDPGPDFTYRIEDVVSDLIGLLDSLGIKGVHHVGESTGGIVGAMAAAQYPGYFRSLTLVSTPVTVMNSDPKVKSPGASSPQESLQTLGLKQWWLQSRAMTDDLFGDDRDNTIAEEFARTPVHVAVEMWSSMHQPRVNLQNYLAKVEVPTLVMTPTRSRTMTLADQRDLVGLLPSVRHRIYDGASHGMYYLRAEELAADFVEFAESV
jgi:pimeloyl-ACP methyl ester carboxylesterase